MSEKPTEIIYVDETIYNEPPPGEASGMKKGEWRELAIMHYRTAYILKSKFDELSKRFSAVEANNTNLKAAAKKRINQISELEKENQNLKNLLKMKIAGGGGLPLQGTGGYAGTVPQGNVQIIIAGGGAGGESHTEQKIEDNPDFTHKGGAFMKGGSV